MPSVFDSIARRRSIRAFRNDPVPDDAISQMLEAARLAPSGSNKQPWRFIVVTSAAERAKLREICLGQAFIEQAPVVLVCCADLDAYSQGATRQRYQEFIESGVTQTLSGRFSEQTFWAERLSAQPVRETVLVTAIANTYIAITHMILVATELGLGTCWVGALGGERGIERFFNLPPSIVAVSVLPVGYPVSVPSPRPRLPLSKILLRPFPPPGK